MRTLLAVLLSAVLSGCSCGPPTCEADSLSCQLDGLEIYESDEAGTLKQKLDLTEIDTANTVNIWAGGSSGAIFKYTGSGWRAETQIAQTKPLVWGLWGSSPSDMWASQGDGTLLHNTGDGWKNFAVPTDAGLFDVHGTGADDVWVVGEKGTVLHVAGGTATPMPSGATNSLYAVWANSPTDAWAAGYGGAMYKFNGTSWSATTSPAADHIWELWGTAANNLYAVSDNNGAPNRGNLYHYDGAGWSQVSLGSIPGLRSVFGVSATDIWAVGLAGTAFRYDGAAWKKVAAPSSDPFFSLWGLSSNNLFFGLASTDAFIQHYDGQKFTPSFPQQGTARKLFGLGCCKDHANLEKPTLNVVSQPEPLTFNPEKESAPIQLGWTDPYPCRPAICFMICPKGMRCSTRARCTQGTRDNLPVGQAWFSVRPSKAEPAESHLYDLGVFPISGKECPPKLSALKDGQQDVAVGPPLLLPTKVTAEEPGGTGGGSGAGFVEGTLTSVQCRFVSAGIAGFNQYELTASGTARASQNAGIFFEEHLAGSTTTLNASAESCDGWNTLNSGCNRGSAEKTDITWTARQGEEFQGTQTLDFVLTGALPGGEGTKELARQSVTCAP